jgi:hypothetical protein
VRSSLSASRTWTRRWAGSTQPSVRWRAPPPRHPSPSLRPRCSSHAAWLVTRPGWSRGLAGHDAGHVRPRAPRRDHEARRGLQVAVRAQLPARRQEATDRLVCLGPPGDAPGRRPRDHQLTGLTKCGDKPPATGQALRCAALNRQLARCAMARREVGRVGRCRTRRARRGATATFQVSTVVFHTSLSRLRVPPCLRERCSARDGAPRQRRRRARAAPGHPYGRASRVCTCAGAVSPSRRQTGSHSVTMSPSRGIPPSHTSGGMRETTPDASPPAPDTAAAGILACSGLRVPGASGARPPARWLAREIA